MNMSDRRKRIRDTERDIKRRRDTKREREIEIEMYRERKRKGEARLEFVSWRSCSMLS